MVPLVMGLSTLIVSYIMIAIGPYLETVMSKISNGLLGLGGFGAFIYGIAHRLLVPSGLHHILNNFFWFQVGLTRHLLANMPMEIYLGFSQVIRQQVCIWQACIRL